MSAIWAVSYTHLDVYKRQHHEHVLARGLAAGALECERERKRDIGDLLAGELDAQALADLAGDAVRDLELVRLADCLLYTSRCV